ncbi:transposase [Microcystis aeruginosa NIES-3804]|uniref:Transposase n=8 Tax=Microcystis TaxID=1125 RepID=A0A6H9GAK1_MICAE|nr:MULTISPECIES: IS1634 family transposase [Terrabacteria group]ELS47089.1 transposase [Microcystis aeruginosa FACHB-905 = DIANCHI905]WKX60603.1 IS1634 family transposase [Microcystis aeruginosa PCC 7806]WKX60633.1 IS1634 family transposase [Microcystis aeruginosa PCC 7806]WKX60703.1 IS1634 family transposase [Microcystis aeruginosa PCC 7806]WKX60709.1 IS1634 family transposase [Microcystis aeruginosa PCC 7806]
MKLKPQEIEIQNIDHLGIVAGIIDSIGIVEIINELIGVEKDEKVNAGQVVKAMIINGLGFVSKPLYMFPEYFETIACEHLIGTGVKPEYLNDDKLGRVMDKLFIKGLDTIFFIIAVKAAQKFGVSLSTSHLDSSSIHVHGQYNTSLPEVIFENQKIGNNQELEEIAVKSPKEITITYGYSRDHRPDLKQFIIEMICSGDGDIPIFLKLASGNQADSSCFGQIAVEYHKQLEVNSLMVADSALYTESNLKMMSDLQWLCRVPLSIKAAKSLISTIPESEFIDSTIPGYKLVSKTENYAGIEQRWLVVQSQERRESDLRKLTQKITKAESKAVLDLKKLSQERFACEADAIKALSKLSTQFKYHQINESKVTPAKSNKKDSLNEISYQISATVCQDESKINTELLSAGRFIIATNVLDSQELSDDSMLREYKAQQSCERGFGFLKDPLFFADSIFLKSPERIESMGMIMGLCLLVYTLAQRQIRNALKESKSTIKNQLGKATNSPTLRWIFQCFHCIHLITLNQEEHISNWNKDRDFILRLLPDDCLRYYQLAT